MTIERRWTNPGNLPPLLDVWLKKSRFVIALPITSDDTEKQLPRPQKHPVA
jgi:hypothetical protein